MSILLNAEREIEYYRREIHAQVEADAWEAMRSTYATGGYYLYLIAQQQLN